MNRYQRQAQRHPRLAQRARRQGRISTGPDRRAANRQIGHIKDQRGRQIKNIQRKGQGAARSAIKTTNREADFERGLAQNLKGVATPGLVRRQLRAGAAQVERYGQGLATISRRAASQDIRGVKQQAREDIYNTKESVRGIQHQATAEALASLVQAKRQRQRDALQQAQQDALDKIQAQRKRQRGRLQDAIGVIDDRYSSIVGALEVPQDQRTPTQKRLAQIPLPQSDQDWAHFAEAIQLENPSMSPRDVQAAVDRFRTRQTSHATSQAKDVIEYWRRVLGL